MFDLLGHEVNQENDIFLKNNKGIKMRVSVYYCPVCQKRYTSSILLPINRSFKYEGKNIQNIELRKKSSSSITFKNENAKNLNIDGEKITEEAPKDSISDRKVIEKKVCKSELKVYVMNPKHKISLCGNCNFKLNTVYVNFEDRKNKTLGIRQCPNCGNVYVTYTNYINNTECFHVLNSSDMEIFLAIYRDKLEKRRERRAKRKQNKSDKCVEEKKKNIQKVVSSYSIKEAKRKGYARIEVNNLKVDFLEGKKREKNLAQQVGISKGNSKYYAQVDLVNVYTNEKSHYIISNCKKQVNVEGEKTEIPISSGLGETCIDAIANDYEILEFDGKRYLPDRIIRYDPRFIETFKRKESKPIIPERKNIIEEVDYIYVYYKLTNTCVTKGHNIESVTIKVNNLKTMLPVSVNAFYCKTCNRYFINHEILHGFYQKNIYPAFHYIIIGSVTDDWKPVSELRLYGYTVSEGKLTSTQRQSILFWIIDSEMMTKHEIIRNIESKIDYNGKKVGNEGAKEKWIQDIEFVSTYVKNNKRNVTGKLVRPK